MNKRIGTYAIEEIAPAVYAIDNDDDESMYLVCGQDKAFLIDTGSAAEPLLPVVRALWQGPVELLLTHAHFDHIYHSDEFSRVSLLQDEIDAWGRVLRPIVWISTVGSGKRPKRYPVRTWNGLREGDCLPLGERTLHVIAAKGHTPGSAIFVDEADRLVFAGDAFGSGSCAWMWMPGCSPVSEYRDSLRALIKKLEPYRDYRMLGGHRRQGLATADDPHAHPLDFETLQDMEVLCGKLLRGELSPESTERNFGIKNDLYRFGKAAIVLTKGKIR